MILYLRIRHNTRRLETWNPGPRLWEKGAQRQGGLFEQGDQDRDPAAVKDTDHAQAGRSPLAPLAGQGVGDIEQRARGDRLLGRAADTEQPQRGHGHRQPQAGGAVGLGHAGALPLPARAFDTCELLFDPGPQAIPTRLAGVGRQIGQDQPGVLVSLFPAGQQVQRRRRWGLLKAVPVPRQRVPGWGTKLSNGR